MRPRTEVTGGAAGQSKGDRTRRRVLDAAAAVFAREGIVAASMGDVAAAVGMKAGSLYFHFPSKDALVSEVVREGIEQALTHLQRTVDLQRGIGASAHALLRAAIEAHVVALHELSDYATVVARSVADRDRRPTDPYLPLERQYARYWIELLEEAQAAGVVPPDQDPRLIRDLLFGAMNATPMRARPPEQIARALAALIGVAGN
jgi:TetR/AcrR family transcriptional regulator, cholesterol catabolism regulator